jgi:hypothetical protein
VSKFPIVLLYRIVTNLIHAYAAKLVVARRPRNKKSEDLRFRFLISRLLEKVNSDFLDSDFLDSEFYIYRFLTFRLLISMLEREDSNFLFL